MGTFLWSYKSALFPTTVNTTSFRLRFSSEIDERIFTCKSHPRLNIKVWLGIGDIVDNNNPWGPFVVNFAERFITLLAGSVPNGDFDVLISDLDDFR